MTQYKTPGVYVEEVSTLPPSVVEVSTAIPAFVGCTEKGGPDDDADPVTVARISTLLEYEQLFGGPPQSYFTVAASNVSPFSVTRDIPDDAFDSILYYCVSHYFKNGGGSCYIVSVGSYSHKPDVDAFKAGLDTLTTQDEPTLIILSEAAQALTADNYSHQAVQDALSHCARMGDRFAILDVPLPEDATVENFRDKIGTNHLKYGAAYTPYLETTLSYQYEDSKVSVTEYLPGDPFATAKPGAQEKKTTGKSKPTIEVEPPGSTNLAQLRTTNTALYSQIKTLLGQQTVTLPPAAAVAGIYASVDRERGVWKAPANVGVSAVLGPKIKFDNLAQEFLNVDPTSGKSSNAIRSFTGKGTLVWGARTLDGNSNEWRYVPVRRLFIMLEESCQKATSFAVFEPNDLSTWLKVKGMIESFLYGLWEQGAFAGSKPEDAYYVHVGLGTTMTTDDIHNGRMIVEVGVAAVRPAEFIVLRFSHKLQES